METMMKNMQKLFTIPYYLFLTIYEVLLIILHKYF